MQIPDDILEPALTDQYFHLRGLSVYSSMGIATLRDYLRAGDLPHFKLKGKLLIKRSDFDQWLEKYRSSNKKQNLNELIDGILKELK